MLLADVAFQRLNFLSHVPLIERDEAVQFDFEIIPWQFVTEQRTVTEGT